MHIHKQFCNACCHVEDHDWVMAQSLYNPFVLHNHGSLICNQCGIYYVIVSNNQVERPYNINNSILNFMVVYLY